jgi:alpha-glucosidase
MQKTTALFRPVLAFIAVLTAAARAQAPAPLTIESPDGRLQAEFLLQDHGTPAYRILSHHTPIILNSRLGFQNDLYSDFTVLRSATSSHHENWTPLYGERHIIPNNYTQLDIDLKHLSGRLLRITFRAFNEGVALRYTFDAANTQPLTLDGEQTEFHLPDQTLAYEEHGTEGEYHLTPIADMAPWCERPLTLELPHGLLAAIGEADNQRYPRMLLSPLTGSPHTLVTALGGTSSNLAGTRSPQRSDSTLTLAPGDSTPWRFILVGDQPGDLLEHDYLLLNLCPPPSPATFADTSWIKPGKIMRDTALTTENSKACIDFASTGGFQYILWDDGWYGTEDPATGDATTVRHPNLNLQEVLDYGKPKNVGLFLYVDRRQMKKQRDILFPLYEKLGVKGVKIGFVNVGPQEETTWITDTIQKAAEHHLLLDIHDGYRATGNARTYPNLLTIEGVRGNEHFPTPEHNCTLPFTRFISGAADYTICYYDHRLHTTHAHQLALAVLYYSPLTAVYWYDRPSQFANEPELEFFRHVPTVWDDTRVLDGQISQFASIARRSGDTWFVGTINNSEPRQLHLPLSFLTPNKHYLAHLYADDNTAPTKTKVAVTTRPVDDQTILDVSLSSAGGQALWIEPLP